MTRLEQLEAKLAARKDKPGFEKNCEEIQAQIDRLKNPPTPQEFDL